jgi:hypothetical protein
MAYKGPGIETPTLRSTFGKFQNKETKEEVYAAHVGETQVVVLYIAKFKLDANTWLVFNEDDTYDNITDEEFRAKFEDCEVAPHPESDEMIKLVVKMCDFIREKEKSGL